MNNLDFFRFAYYSSFKRIIKFKIVFKYRILSKVEYQKTNWVNDNVILRYL